MNNRKLQSGIMEEKNQERKAFEANVEQMNQFQILLGQAAKATFLQNAIDSDYASTNSQKHA